MSGSGPTVVVDVDDELADIDVERWSRLATATLADEGVVHDGELTLSFVTSEAIATLNGAHLDGSGPTDVLAFPIDGGDAPADPTIPQLLGDVIVCPEQAAGNAATRGRPLDDELALLVVHGVLHVLGHDHAEPDEARRMQAREAELLTRHNGTGR